MSALPAAVALAALTDGVGTGRRPAQWLTPRQIERNPECLTCSYASLGDRIDLTRYSTPHDALEQPLPSGRMH